MRGRCGVVQADTRMQHHHTYTTHAHPRNISGATHAHTATTRKPRTHLHTYTTRTPPRRDCEQARTYTTTTHTPRAHYAHHAHTSIANKLARAHGARGPRRTDSMRRFRDANGIESKVACCCVCAGACACALCWMGAGRGGCYLRHDDGVDGAAGPVQHAADRQPAGGAGGVVEGRRPRPAPHAASARSQLRAAAGFGYGGRWTRRPAMPSQRC
jgi:hypothetical protein